MPIADAPAEDVPAYRPGPADWLWTAAKSLVIGAFTSVIALGVVVAFVPTLFSGKRGPSQRAQIRRPAVRCWGRLMTRTLGVRIAVEGEPPPPGALLVSNHLSYLDIPVFASLLGFAFVSKDDVRRWPFWGQMADLGGTIYIDRSRRRDALRTLAGMQRALECGAGVVIFPEATSTSGDTIRPFRPALLADAADRQRPVHWATITYRLKASPTNSNPDSLAPRARERVCWWGEMPFLPHLAGLCALKRVYCHVRFGDSPVQSADRKALAETLRQTMLQAHTPVRR